MLSFARLPFSRLMFFLSTRERPAVGWLPNRDDRHVRRGNLAVPGGVIDYLTVAHPPVFVSTA